MAYRRVLLSVVLAGAGLLITAPTGIAQDSGACLDFRTQDEAQAFYTESGGPTQDPHGLDADGDGNACESLPTRSAGGGGSARSAFLSQVDDRDCADFGSQQEAQEFYEQQGGPANDPHDLDPDRDGVACEEVGAQASPGASPAASPAATTAPATATPAPTPTATPQDDLPNSGTETAAFGFAGLTLLCGGFVMTKLSRSTADDLAKLPPPTIKEFR